MKKEIQFVILLIIALGLIAVIGSIYVGIIEKNLVVNKQKNAIQPTIIETEPNIPSIATTSPTTPSTDWKTYTNSKYGYSLMFPSDYLVGYFDARVGIFNTSNGNEDQIDFLASETDEFNNFLQIQVNDLKIFNKTLDELVSDIYKKQKSDLHPITISDITKSKFNNYDNYEYSFSGQGFSTISWIGAVKSGKYKVVIFQKDEKVYSFFLKDNAIFNQILSTFKFTK